MTDKTNDPFDPSKYCDGLVYRAAQFAVDKGGADLETFLDRLLTFGAAQLVALEGPGKAAFLFRYIADQIEGGVFDHLQQSSKGRVKH